jgi:hypothetical protein
MFGAVLLIFGACSSASGTGPAQVSSPAPPSVGASNRDDGTAPASAYRMGIAATLNFIARLQDDLDVNGNLTVPQNRYNLDVRRLAESIRRDQGLVADDLLDASTRSQVAGLLASASGLAANLQASAPKAGRDALTELAALSSVVMAVQRDVG